MAPQPLFIHNSIPSTVRLGGDTPLLIVWGGLGFSRRPIRDLRDLFALYTNELTEFLQHCSNILQPLLVEEAKAAGDASEVKQGLMEWITGPSRRSPSVSHAVTMAVTTILQMSRYVLLCKRLGKTPGDIARSASAFTGHSVGIYVAIGMAAADSWESLYTIADGILTGTFHGEKCAGAVWDGKNLVSQASLTDCMRRGEGTPSPMLSVAGLDYARLAMEMDVLNEQLPTDRKLHLALTNDVDSYVVAGGPEGLVGLCARLRAPAPNMVRQQHQCSLQFIPVSSPFHSPHIQNCTASLAQKMESFVINKSDLLVPVWDLDSFLDAHSGEFTENISPLIGKLIYPRAVDWPGIMRNMNGKWQVLDFGPGGSGGVGALINKMKSDPKTRVYTMFPTDTFGGSKYSADAPPMLSVVSNDPNSQTYARINLAGRCLPESNTDAASGKTLRSKFTEVMGLPRVLVAGMTPTTCDIDLVAAIMNAGFYVEFATGGYHDADSLATAIKSLASKIPSGRLITLNIIYANPRGLSWMIPQIATLVRQGCPIGGITIGAGVPDATVVSEWIKLMELSYIGFKPASSAAILQVLDIARAHPTLPVLLQWTGGRAGGHHSREDFHQPILDTYQAIREVNNVILVGGSGFGDATGSWPYISGEWSQAFGRGPMPFDATLIGTCIMTTQEAKTSPAVKQAMVNAPGVKGEDWQASMQGGAGGVISIISHLGEAMHVIATRGMLLWAEMDKTLFNLPKDKMLARLTARKSEIITRLNNDHQKVWFGLDYDLMKPVDICDMTYFSVLRRLVDLVHPERTGSWTHRSYREIVNDWLMRILERFGESPNGFNLLADPRDQVKEVATKLPEADQHLLSLEDTDYFIDLCGMRGRKPVPFIPVLDIDFPVWFKKDPLWQSENLDATFHGDADRVCTLAGPVALQYCNEMDVPVAIFLQGIEQGYLDKEASLGLSKPASSLASPLYEMDELVHLIGASCVSISADQLQIAQDCPGTIDDDLWLLLLGSKLGHWGRQLLGTRKLISGGKAYQNPARLIFKAQPGSLVRLSGETGDGYSTAEMYVGGGQGKEGVADAKVSIDGSTITILVFNPYTSDSQLSEFQLKFEYDTSRPYFPIAEERDGQGDRLTDFLGHVFFGPAGLAGGRLPPTVSHIEVEVTKERVLEWMKATDGQGLDIQETHHLGVAGEVPIEYSTILVMTLIWQLLLIRDWDVAKLLHRRTTISVKEGQRTLAIGDKLNVEWGLVGLHNTDSGIDAEFHMTFFRNGQEAIGLVYLFSVLNERVEDSKCFGTLGQSIWTLPLATEADIEVLISKSWVNPIVPRQTFQPGQILRFELVRELSGKTTGNVWIQKEGGKGTLCARVDPSAQETSGADLVADFMNRRGTRAEEQVRLPEAKALKTQAGKAFKITVPENSVEYCEVTKDFNPNHTLPAFARYSGWREPICQGNQTAALVLKLIRQEVPGASVSTLRKYDCDFRSVVYQGDTLAVSVKQVAMKHGGTVLSFTAVREGSDEVVVAGVVELEAPPTTFLFTGQGSQFAGMGLDMIPQSRPTRKIWAEADEYFESNWGFSLSDIVRRNPTSLTVNFSSRQGARVRQSYLAAQSILEDCDPSDRRVLFEGLHAKSRSFTFRHEDGMLSMTQFAQPAILVLERAAFEHLKSLGRVPRNACFAGHSLGEFAALGCMTEIWTLQAALKTVFIRGTLMQMAVPRDSRGRSGFGMAAVDPSRVRKGFSESDLRHLVDTIAQRTGLVLEMVNLNIRGKQYVCAGDKRGLDILREITDALQASESVLDITEQCEKLVNERTADVLSKLATDVVLKGGKALIPLPGIDVPFHSSTMSSMAKLFRRTLVTAVDSEKVKTEDLVGKWIPNVTGKPFSTDKAYLDMVIELTGSAKLISLVAAI
ncbi:beta subunit of fatty acid synthetase [Gnomoniopsis smithogilvyi]|uniref:Beta subunit of fatty acid synthetase n=1 Tax=Gnomoniopsis smithogilvyi TaxID=1191159 RepID=A0A9W8YLI4_9PEZI|nr:beta subunit of fatty acid synthetase [Gnomoniopsis smithogilvyi]